MAGDNPKEPKPGSAEYDLQQIFLQEPMPDNPPYNPPDPQEPKREALNTFCGRFASRSPTTLLGGQGFAGSAIKI